MGMTSCSKMYAVGVGSLNVIKCVETGHCLLNSVPEAPFSTKKTYQNTKIEICGELSDVIVSLSLLRKWRHRELK